MDSKINDIFDEIFNLYGKDDEIMQMKNDLLYVYANEKKWRCDEILKLIKPKQWYIDENGNIKSANTK